MTDVPEAAVDAAMAALTEELKHWGANNDREVQVNILAAAAPHIRADGRARVLAEVQAALRDEAAYLAWSETYMRIFVSTWSRVTAADYLRDTVGAGEG